MVNCPICRKEHNTWANMSTHMILIAINRRGDDHGRYLDLLTGKDQQTWGHRNDAAVGNLMKRYYKKLGRLPTLEELEEARGDDSRINTLTELDD
ncbi:MAG: hypothetical protein PHQ43_05235 [Dehalococcoidales bacterium]|nr:hypothetical protein [Dehalococcoidales bacterium]